MNYVAGEEEYSRLSGRGSQQDRTIGIQDLLNINKFLTAYSGPVSHFVPVLLRRTCGTLPYGNLDEW